MTPTGPVSPRPDDRFLTRARPAARRGTRTARAVALTLAFAAAAEAVVLFLQYALSISFDALDVVRAVLIGVTTFWLAWGATQSFVGLFYREPAVPRLPDSAPIKGRTAVLMPVYNEDPVAVLARVSAMDVSLAEAGLTEQVDIAVLSDTRSDAIAAEEARWFARLVAERDGAGRMFYRRRAENTGKKAGNIEEFIRNSGGRYDYALILDADSLMEGATLAEMIRRMEAAPDLGLLQTLPRIVNARSLFGRAMQFAASFYSPIFARGLAAMQGTTGPFWGHNALIRVQAFAWSCGLPQLSGKPPFGGPIMSHDYVEAALLARAGWTVRLDPDLGGSFEEGPEDMVEFAQRDRRWCQGNLQYVRLLGAPGMRLWSRYVFLQAILSYISPLLWLGLLIVSVPAAMWQIGPDYFPAGQIFPVFPSDETAKAIGLAVGIGALLVLPKLAIFCKAWWTGAVRLFGGTGRSFASATAELALSTVIAPVMLMFTTRSVLQVLTGRDGGWPANARGDGAVPLRTAWAASWWIALVGAGGLIATYLLAAELLPWMLPVGGPMLLAAPIVSYTSRRHGKAVFTVPQERHVPPVLARYRLTRARWQAEAAMPAPSHDLPQPGPAPVAAPRTTVKAALHG
ncbi:MAG: glucans biosynthesis glucosyltransferase MdoH [Confluentimicrobium sp.]|nr:glucans biosynthesis glucosyltransferase MdoH [Actibacterium sp.]